MRRKKRNRGLTEEQSAVLRNSPRALPEIPQSERQEIRGAPERTKVQGVLSVFPSVGQGTTNDDIPAESRN